MIKIRKIHHVSLPVSDLQRARQFYSEILGLREIVGRPAFPFDGAWYQVGDAEDDYEVHLIIHDKSASTFREGKPLDSRDVHFAIRVDSYRETRDFLLSKGYKENAEDELMELKSNADNLTPWRQLYIMDPDRNVIELNAKRLTGDE